MRYILKDGYIDEISFGATIECKNRTCTEYTGTIPTGYTSLEEWAIGEEGKLNAWKLTDGNLVFDNAKYEELQDLWNKQAEDNTCVTRKEIYGMQQQLEEIQDISNSGYSNVTSSGKITSFNNVKKCFPKIKITGIDCYDYESIDLFINGKNLLRNEAVTQKINGVKFTQNKDRSISISGTSTATVEYDIAGTSSNTGAFLCFKKNETYYLSGLKNKTIKMYYYDGTNRTQIYSGSDGTITFTDSDKLVTQIVLSIESGTTVNRVTIYPQLEYGTAATDYETYQGKSYNINFSKFIEEGLFPSDDVYPSDDLYPEGTTIDYILIENSKITVSVNSVAKDLENTNVVLSNGNNTIFTLQDTNLETTYCVDNLDYMRGKATSSNKFRILEDGSIEAHDGFFSGNINTDKDIAVGNNLYVGQDQTPTGANIKYIYFSDNAYLKRFIMSSGKNYLQMFADLCVKLSCNDNSDITIMDNSIQLSCNDTGYINIEPDSIVMSHTPNIISDERLKKNIKDVDVYWINNIQVKEFEYKNTPNKKQIGVIAQDYIDKDYSKYFLSKHESDDAEYYSVTYGNITNALIKYCQELNKKIDSLENRIKELEER